MTRPEALRDWEEFLTSFKNCVKMRDVDLSENRLGDKGIETLVRVYTREMRDFIDDAEENISDELLSRSISHVSTKSDEEDEDPDTLAASAEYGSSPASCLAASALIKSNRGR